MKVPGEHETKQPAIFARAIGDSLGVDVRDGGSEDAVRRAGLGAGHRAALHQHRVRQEEGRGLSRRLRREGWRQESPLPGCHLRHAGVRARGSAGKPCERVNKMLDEQQPYF